jgi:hypothetical protein
VDSSLPRACRAVPSSKSTPSRCKVCIFRLLPIHLLIYRKGCLEFIDQRTLFFKANSGSELESYMIAEYLMQYGFHFFVFNKYSSISCSLASFISSPLSSNRSTQFLSCFIIVFIASSFTCEPLCRLHMIIPCRNPLLVGILFYTIRFRVKICSYLFFQINVM